MKHCKNCNQDYLDDKKFCKKCGEPLIEKHEFDFEEVKQKAFSDTSQLYKRNKKSIIGIVILVLFTSAIYYFVLRHDPVNDAKQIAKDHCDCFEKYDAELLKINSDWLYSLKTNNFKNYQEATSKLFPLKDLANVQFSKCNENVLSKINSMKARYSSDQEKLRIFFASFPPANTCISKYSDPLSKIDNVVQFQLSKIVEKFQKDQANSSQIKGLTENDRSVSKDVSVRILTPISNRTIKQRELVKTKEIVKSNRIEKPNEPVSTIPTNQKPFRIKDVEGNIYQTIQIGTQVWMTENLKTTKFRNGEQIPNIIHRADWKALSSEAYCWYNNDETNKSTYGALYNWYAVNDIRNIAPIGWHVASDEEWTKLILYLQGVNVAGGKLKETGLIHWTSPNTGATNSSGYIALPGGCCSNDGSFDDLGNLGYWWTSSEIDPKSAWRIYLYYGLSNINRYSGNKQYGFSVRCIRD